MSQRITDEAPPEKRVEPAVTPRSMPESAGRGGIPLSRRLIEWLVVLGVVVVVLGLLLPGAQKIRESPRWTYRMYGLKQIGIGLHHLAGAYGDRVPPSVGRFLDEKGHHGTLWFHLLPFVEEDPLHRKILRDHPGGEVREDAATRVQVYRYCGFGDPSNPGDNGQISCASNHGVFGDRPVRYVSKLTGKGLANTVVVVSRSSVHAGGVSTWAAPAPLATYVSGTNGTVVGLTGIDHRTAPRDAAHGFNQNSAEVLLADGSSRRVQAGSPGFAQALDVNDLRLLPTEW